MFTLSDVLVWGAGNEDKQVTLWRVSGIAGTWYPSKVVAEKAARNCFPDEDEHKRYARVSYRVFEEV